MDIAEPPRVVFECAAECVDRDRAGELFRQAITPARARGWAVTIRIQPATLPAVTAEGEITDETGAVRAHQVTSGTVSDCAGLANAMGAWASAALTSEAQRAQPAEPLGSQPAGGRNQTLQTLPAPPPDGPNQAVAPAPPSPAAGPVVASAPRPATSSRAAGPAVPFVSRPGQPEAPSWASPSQNNDERAPLEFGVGTFMMSGGGAGGYIGITPFLMADVGQGVFLRPSVALGGSMATNVPSTWAAARLDTCMRLPGRYAVRGGLQLDLCGGADVGFSYVASGTQAGTPATGQTFPYVDVGPSVDLRAEVGKLAVTLRAIGGIDVARSGFVDVTGTRQDASAVCWRLEVDLSWVLHDERTEALVAQ
jgi:hypothetical protein